MTAHWNLIQDAFGWLLVIFAGLLGLVLIFKKLEDHRPAGPLRKRVAQGVLVLLWAALASLGLAVVSVAWPMRQGFAVLNGSEQAASLILDGHTVLRLPPRSFGRVARHGWSNTPAARLQAGPATHELGRLREGLYAVNVSSDTWIEGGAEGDIRTAIAAYARPLLPTPRLEGPGARRMSDDLDDSLVESAIKIDRRRRRRACLTPKPEARHPCPLLRIPERFLRLDKADL